VQVNFGERTRVFAEQTIATNNIIGYAYLEATFGGGAFGQVFAEVKGWKIPLYAHLEARTTFDGFNAYFAGLAWALNSKHGYFTIEPLYRYDTASNLQLSVAYNYDWNWCDIYGYADWWGTNTTQLYSETRYYINIAAGFALGAILDIYASNQVTLTPYLGVRYKF